MSPGPKPVARLLDAITARAQPICLSLLFISVAALLALPALQRKIKFDEKSLLVGGARPVG